MGGDDAGRRAWSERASRVSSWCKILIYFLPTGSVWSCRDSANKTMACVDVPVPGSNTWLVLVTEVTRYTGTNAPSCLHFTDNPQNCGVFRWAGDEGLPSRLCCACGGGRLPDSPPPIAPPPPPSPPAPPLGPSPPASPPCFDVPYGGRSNLLWWDHWRRGYSENHAASCDYFTLDPSRCALEKWAGAEPSELCCACGGGGFAAPAPPSPPPPLAPPSSPPPLPNMCVLGKGFPS